jgi:hypothetical protein
MNNWQPTKYYSTRNYLLKYKPLIVKGMQDYRGGIWTEFDKKNEQVAYERGRHLAVIFPSIKSLFHGKGLKREVTETLGNYKSQGII